MSTQLTNNQRAILKTLTIVVSILTFFGILIFYGVTEKMETQETINNLNCYDLRQYIADREWRWEYGVHKYTWDCEK